jgi:hypothetical protein
MLHIRSALAVMIRIKIVWTFGRDTVARGFFFYVYCKAFTCARHHNRSVIRTVCQLCSANDGGWVRWAYAETIMDFRIS